MGQPIIYSADRIFTGERWMGRHAVMVNNGRIGNVLPLDELPRESGVKEFSNSFIAPAFIDLQIYGAYGKLLAVYPESGSLRDLVKYCRKGGAAYCLPTVATNKPAVFHNCIDAVKKYWDEGNEGVLGLHIEGPWISKEKRGAHIDSLIQSPDLSEVKELLNYGKGVIKMITVAPEVCRKEVIELANSFGVVVSAGHTNASYVEAIRGFENGIRAVTHLYNAMSGLNHREPGLVGATFDDDKVMASIIPDGHHVGWPAISIAKKILGERLFAITDAVTETSEGYYHHQLSGDKYEAGGILSGSALTMNKALQNLVKFAGIELSEALRMCSLYPARVLKLENELGRIEKGYKSCMVVLDEKLEFVSLLA
jgi:N-acetylglucosamine-6-phosphate deacetylase